MKTGDRRTRWIVLLSLVCVLLLLPLASCPFWWDDGLPGSVDQELRLLDHGPITLDPAISADMSSHTYVVHIFSGLVRLDHELNIVADIAESWEISPDGRTYTFYLRQDVTFHNGREVKAADFKYSWERACDPATGSGTAATYLGDIVGVGDMLAGRAEEISGVEVIDDYTLRVIIGEPRVYFLSKLSYPTAFVVDSADVESGINWWRGPNGTGPFQLEEWREGQWLVLVRNENYYGQPAKLDQVVFYLLAGAPMMMYEMDQIDVASVYFAYIDRVRDEAGPFYGELAASPELSLYYLGFNTARPPFDDANVRLAFCHAVDKERIATVIFRDMMSVADGILPPGMPGYDETLEGQDYDVEKALELIAASRYGDVSNLPPITLTLSGYGNYIPGYLGAIVQEWQQNLGVEVSVRQLEPEKFVYHLGEEKDDVYMMGWIADYPDPHNFLDVLFSTGSQYNFGGYANFDLDALLDQAAVEQDEGLRMAMYQQAERLVIDEAACLPLLHGVNHVLVKPHVKGYELSPMGIPDLTRVYIDR
ncbi:MAG: peptide ABC transporter substrate-binding protein [Dehalococcoidia bacterium]|nr:peptide ABC transporter substrate-binding protein [Dehalococcoidia bacterium]